MPRTDEWVRADQVVGAPGFLESLKRWQAEQREMVGRLLAMEIKPVTIGNQWAYDRQSQTVSPKDPRYAHYWIPVKDLKNPAHREKWVWHLSEKRWVTEWLLVDLLAWGGEV